MKNKRLILIAITGILILTAGIIAKQKFFLMIPLFISLFIMAGQAEASRYASLGGAVNALIYTVMYLYLGVYASAASAALFSFPVQLLTFFRWKKNAYKKTVIFKKMKNKTRVILSLIFLALWTAMSVTFSCMNYEYAILDSGVFLLGFIIPVLTLLAYVEYTYLWIVNAVINVMLNIQLVSNDYHQITYLIYSLYNLYCIILAFINVRKFYKEQQEVSK